MAWKQIILEGGFPQWVEVPEDPLEQAGRIVDEGYSKPAGSVLKSRFTGWNVRGALFKKR